MLPDFKKDFKRGTRFIIEKPKKFSLKIPNQALLDEHSKYRKILNISQCAGVFLRNNLAQNSTEEFASDQKSRDSLDSL